MAKQSPEEALKYLLRMGNLESKTILQVMVDLEIDPRTVQRLIKTGLERGTYYVDREIKLGLIDESMYKIPTTFDVGYSIVVKGELIDPNLLKLFKVKDRDMVLSLLFHNMRMDDCLVRVTAHHDNGHEYTLDGYIRRNGTDRVNIYQENLSDGYGTEVRMRYPDDMEIGVVSFTRARVISRLDAMKEFN